MNAGGYVIRAQLKRLKEACARAIYDAYGLDFDVLFGPACKGIPIAGAAVIAFEGLCGKPMCCCSDRKEDKDQGADKGGFLGMKLQDGDRVVCCIHEAGSGRIPFCAGQEMLSMTSW